MNMPAPVQASVVLRRRSLVATLRAYWPLIKGLQTTLLLITGLAGYAGGLSSAMDWTVLPALTGSLLLAISGSTILNMVHDRDIDAKMERTASRPLPAGRIAPRQASQVGLALSWLGVGWAFSLAPLYGLVVFAGFFLDVAVYTLWLKRRTPWSIIWGGISGGMPILAGRVLALGRIDLVGVLLALGVLTWIPSHIMPLTIKYLEDYRRAGVPTFPEAYGVGATRAVISVSTGVAVAAMLASAQLSGVTGGYLFGLALLGLVLLIVAGVSAVSPSPRLNFGLFKFASLYMLGSMALMLVA